MDFFRFGVDFLLNLEAKWEPKVMKESMKKQQANPKEHTMKIKTYIGLDVHKNSIVKIVGKKM